MSSTKDHDGFEVSDFYIPGPKSTVNWQLRVEKRRNIYDRLKGVGKLSLLGLTSMLTGYENRRIDPLVEESNFRTVFKNSYMYRNNKRITNRNMLKLPTQEYKRAEEAFQSFMLSVCLAVKEQDDHPTLLQFNKLKLWVYSHSANGGVDQVCTYFKWLAKATQMLFLGRTVPEPESWFPVIDGTFHPYLSGDFKFLGEFFEKRFVDRRLSIAEAEIVVQLCNGVRSLPYPSHRQMQDSLNATFKVLTEPVVLKDEDLEKYRLGLKQIRLRLGEANRRDSHISLTSSGCIESPQASGGKAAFLVKKAKDLLCKLWDPNTVKGIEGLKDHLGFVVFEPGISSFHKEGIMLHDIAYLPLEKAEQHINAIDITKERVPFDYGKAMLLTTSRQLIDDGIGDYEGRLDNVYNIPLFHFKTKFKMKVGSIPTRASLVQEKGMKTRMVTTTHASKAQIEQLFGHMVRDYLSRDPFHQLGFDEPDKLWSTLKAYKKNMQKAETTPPN